ncbi:MAG: spore coat protein U domain-containing protein [Pseudomonadota bacterium]
MIESLQLLTRSAAAFVAAMMLALGAGPAAAGTASTTMTVSANVANNCTVTATDLAFGTYTGVTQVDSQFTVDVSCADPTDLNLSDDGGINPETGEGGRRRMAHSGEFLTYRLSEDAGFATEFFVTDSLATNTLAFPKTIYGRIDQTEGGLVPGTGEYTDSVTWTVTW